VNSIPSDVFENYVMVDEEKQSELYFYCSLANFKKGDYKKAHLFIREAMNQNRLSEHLLISKAIRLLNLIIYYEKSELVHLEYEVRSYKRYFAQSKLFKTERLIFKIFSATAANKRLRLMNNEQRRIANELKNVANDRYEQQFLKYFEFVGWAMGLITAKNKQFDDSVILTC
jgi:hypothetical protein